ncbi:hypothetical protein, partial [Terribacillus sp. AE2B 122]
WQSLQPITKHALASYCTMAWIRTQEKTNTKQNLLTTSDSMRHRKSCRHSPMHWYHCSSAISTQWKRTTTQSCVNL